MLIKLGVIVATKETAKKETKNQTIIFHNKVIKAKNKVGNKVSHTNSLCSAIICIV